jgi:hypothetical protein
MPQVLSIETEAQKKFKRNLDQNLYSGSTKMANYKMCSLLSQISIVDGELSGNEKIQLCPTFCYLLQLKNHYFHLFMLGFTVYIGFSCD